VVEPLISIALCTYNGERFLRDQINSVLNQTYSNLEIIIIDDKSTDGTMEILRSFEREFKKIKVHQNEANIGYGKNFEKAIDLCNGDYIALSDQDDIWEEHKISRQLESINENLLNYHNSEFIDSNGNSLKKSIFDICKPYNGNDSRHFLFENCVSGHTILFKKSLKKYLVNFPNGIFYDQWIAYVATNIGSINYIDDKLVKFRRHEENSTDILRQKKRIRNQNNEINKIESFAKFAFNKNDFAKRLFNLTKKRTSCINLELLYFLIKNEETLLHLSRKSKLSKLNKLLRYALNSSQINNKLE
jgi:glycosyltransferase involved in cell wall biosynthesis